MNFTQTRVFRMGSLAIALGLLIGLAPELGAQGRPSDPECSAATLAGSYGFYRTGIAPYGAVAAQGLIFFDGLDSWSMTLNISRNGEISQDEEWNGGYTLGPDCTGEVDGGARIVVVDDGNGFYSVVVREDGFTVYEVGRRIHTKTRRGN